MQLVHNAFGVIAIIAIAAALIGPEIYGHFRRPKGPSAERVRHALRIRDEEAFYADEARRAHQSDFERRLSDTDRRHHVRLQGATQAERDAEVRGQYDDYFGRP